MAEVIIKGVPYDANASFLKGAAMAPTRIREAFWGGSANSCTEEGFDIVATNRLKDKGDLLTNNYLKMGEELVAELKSGNRPIVLGGDHSISYPLIKAYHQVYPKLTILQIDAHTDLYDNFEGDKHSHACPFARIMENRLASRLIQVGIRSLTPHTLAQTERFGVELHTMKAWNGVPKINWGNNPVYISLDLDGLDPSVAPGVAHHEPGGLSFREVLDLIQSIDVPVVGADIVELNPVRDLVDMTAMVAAKFLREIAGIMLKQTELYD